MDFKLSNLEEILKELKANPSNFFITTQKELSENNPQLFNLLLTQVASSIIFAARLTGWYPLIDQSLISKILQVSLFCLKLVNATGKDAPKISVETIQKVFLNLNPPGNFVSSFKTKLYKKDPLIFDFFKKACLFDLISGKSRNDEEIIAVELTASILLAVFFEQEESEKFAKKMKEILNE